MQPKVINTTIIKFFILQEEPKKKKKPWENAGTNKRTENSEEITVLSLLTLTETKEKVWKDSSPKQYGMWPEYYIRPLILCAEERGGGFIAMECEIHKAKLHWDWVQYGRGTK